MEWMVVCVVVWVCVCVCVVQVCVCVVCVHLHMQTSDIILGATGFSSGIALTQFLLHHLIGKAGMGYLLFLQEF
jgi:hypothetical protein